MKTETKSRSFTLTLTAKCNLNCIYCYENNKKDESINFDLCKTIIDNEMRKNDKDEFIYIELFGGEPFLEFDLIKNIYDYMVSVYNNDKWIMFTTTNGTLVHGEIQEWLNNKDRFICGLSLDGTKDMHDFNRSNSFDKIDLEFFKTRYPTQAVKMTITEQSLKTLAKGVIFIHDLGFQVNCNLAYGIDWSNQDNKEILERELMILITYYLSHPNIKPCSMLDFPIDHVCFVKDKKTIRKWCGTGTAMTAYYIDGVKYPCQFFMPVSAADKAIPLGQIKFEKDIEISSLDNNCQDCVVVEACPTCYGANYISTGNIYKKDANLCKLNKIMIRARSYFKALQWEKGLLKLGARQEQCLLESIALIQEKLNIED